MPGLWTTGRTGRTQGLSDSGWEFAYETLKPTRIRPRYARTS